MINIKVKGEIASITYGAIKIETEDSYGIKMDFYFLVDEPYQYKIGSTVEASGELLLGNLNAAYFSPSSFEVQNCEVRNVA